MTALNAVPWITWIRTEGKQREIGHAEKGVWRWGRERGVRRWEGRSQQPGREGEARPRPGAFRGRPAHARLQPATLAANSRMLRADGPSRGHVGQPQRQSANLVPVSRLRSKPSAAARPSSGSHAATTHSTWAGEWPSERLSA